MPDPDAERRSKNAAYCKVYHCRYVCLCVVREITLTLRTGIGLAATRRHSSGWHAFALKTLRFLLMPWRRVLWPAARLQVNTAKSMSCTLRQVILLLTLFHNRNRTRLAEAARHLRAIAKAKRDREVEEARLVEAREARERRQELMYNYFFEQRKIDATCP